MEMSQNRQILRIILVDSSSQEEGETEDINYSSDIFLKLLFFSFNKYNLAYIFVINSWGLFVN